MSTIVIQLPGTFANPSLPYFERDPVIAMGVEWCIDLATAYSYGGGDAANAAQVKDLTRNNRHSTVTVGSGVLAYAGGGFDFAGVANATYLNLPSPSLDAAATEQEWLWCLYLKLPTTANWSNATSNPSNFSKVLAALDSNYINTSPASLGALCMRDRTLTPAEPLHVLVNTTTPEAYSKRILVSDAELTPFYDTVTQIAMWRAADGLLRLRLKNAAGSVSKVESSSVLCTATPISPAGAIGRVESGFVSGSETSFRLYRSWFEDLAVSGRTPTTVLDEDWTRTAARAVFS